MADATVKKPSPGIEKLFQLMAKFTKDRNHILNIIQLIANVAAYARTVREPTNEDVKRFGEDILRDIGFLHNKVVYEPVEIPDSDSDDAPEALVTSPFQKFGKELAADSEKRQTQLREANTGGSRKREASVEIVEEPTVKKAKLGHGPATDKEPAAVAPQQAAAVATAEATVPDPPQPTSEGEKPQPHSVVNLTRGFGMGSKKKSKK